MLKGVALGVAITIVGLLLAAFALVQTGFIPANADATPTRLEIWMATTSLDATLRRDAPKDQNPIAPTEENLRRGVSLFARNCAVCHGSSKGAASPSAIAKGLYQKPPQFATDGVEDDPEGVSFWRIKHGIRLTAMPSFGYSLSDQQIWSLALFLKHMDKLPPSVQKVWESVSNEPISSVNQLEQK